MSQNSPETRTLYVVVNAQGEYLPPRPYRGEWGPFSRAKIFPQKSGAVAQARKYGGVIVGIPIQTRPGSTETSP